MCPRPTSTISATAQCLEQPELLTADLRAFFGDLIG
jgi:hypothetical protein